MRLHRSQDRHFEYHPPPQPLIDRTDASQARSPEWNPSSRFPFQPRVVRNVLFSLPVRSSTIAFTWQTRRYFVQQMLLVRIILFYVSSTTPLCGGGRVEVRCVRQSPFSTCSQLSYKSSVYRAPATQLRIIIERQPTALPYLCHSLAVKACDFMSEFMKCCVPWIRQKCFGAICALLWSDKGAEESCGGLCQKCVGKKLPHTGFLAHTGRFFLNIKLVMSPACGPEPQKISGLCCALEVQPTTLPLRPHT